MAGIALVKAGTITTAATTSVAPAFGQATTAGNTLVARIVAAASSSTGAIATSSAGWVQASQLTGGANGAAVFIKINCAASESAPTFTCTSATYMAADLTEWSGAATFLPVDQTGTGTTNLVMAASVKDKNQGDVAIAVGIVTNSKSSGTFTVSDSWAPASGTEVANQNTGATAASQCFFASAYLLGGHGGAAADTDTFTVTPSTGSIQSRAWAIATLYPSTALPLVDSQPRRYRGLVRPTLRSDRQWDTAFAKPPVAPIWQPNLQLRQKRRLSGFALVRPEIRRDRQWDTPWATKAALIVVQIISQPRRPRGITYQVTRTQFRPTFGLIPESIVVANGFPISNIGSSTLTITTQQIGDVVILFINVIGNRNVYSVSSSNIIWDNGAAIAGYDSGGSGNDIEAWKGTVTAVGSDTINVVLG